MERSTIFHGNTHYFDWAIFNSYVKLPEGIVVCNLYMDIYRVGGWATSWNIVNGKDDIPYMKWKIQFMFETTDYIYIHMVCTSNQSSIGSSGHWFWGWIIQGFSWYHWFGYKQMVGCGPRETGPPGSRAPLLALIRPYFDAPQCAENHKYIEVPYWFTIWLWLT